MSCGDPHETPCLEVLEKVYVYLDSECDQMSRESIKQHLDECGPCLKEFGVEQEVKALVNRCCGDERAPEQLRDAVLVRLRAVGVTRSEHA